MTRIAPSARIVVNESELWHFSAIDDENREVNLDSKSPFT